MAEMASEFNPMQEEPSAMTLEMQQEQVSSECADSNEEAPVATSTLSYTEQRQHSGNASAEIAEIVVDSAAVSAIKEGEHILGEAGKMTTEMLNAQELITVKDRKETSEGTEQNEPLRGQVLIRNKQRGSVIKIQTYSSQNMQDIPSQSHIEPITGNFYQTLLLNTGDSSLVKTYSTIQDSLSTERRRFSTNLAIQSLVLDMDSSMPLSILEAAAFASVLQECLEKLSIFQFVIPARIDERWDENPKTIDDKYGVPDEPRLIFREDIGLLPIIPTVSEKIQRDRTYVHHILDEIFKEIKAHKTYDRFEVTINDIMKTQEGERNLEINCQIWVEQVRQLQELLENQRLIHDQEKQKKIEDAKSKNAEVDNTIFYSDAKLGYVKRWEDARLEQQYLKVGDKEDDLMDVITECANLETADQIVSGEVLTYLQASTKEMEDEIVAWTSQYNEELERREQDITEFKEQMDEQKAALQELYALRNERQEFIDDMLAEKERIRRQEEYWQAVNRAAIIIQSLWRGFIVRNQLGQYKGLWAWLRKRKKLAAKARKKREAWQKKMSKKWGATTLKKLKNIMETEK